jgi:hypothetical protein
MKRLFYIGLIWIAASCKREPLTTYNAADNVYFNYSLGFNTFRDSMDFSFATRDASVKDTVLLVPLGVTGMGAATDRTFKLVVDPASTAVAGTHYELPAAVIHAGKVQDTLRLRFKRTADLASGKKKLVLRLEPNEFFKTDLQYRILGTVGRDSVSVLRFSIAASDILSAGVYWNDYVPYFGTFSIKKVKLIHDLLGMPLDFWTVSPTNERRASAIYYASSTARYLGDQAAQGNVINDEDGTPMKMGAAYP